MYDGKPQLSAFLRVELAADDTALLRRRTQPAVSYTHLDVYKRQVLNMAEEHSHGVKEG